MGGSNLQISLVVLRRKHVDVGGLYDRPAVGPQVCNALLLVQGKDELGQLELQGRFKNRVKQCKAINFDPTKYHQVLVYYLYITYILLIVELRTPAMPVGVGGGKERGGFHLNLRT